MLANAGLTTPIWIYATLPLWPLLGAIATAIMIAQRRPAGGAHWPVVGGAVISAVLGVCLFFELGNAHPTGGGAHAPAAAALDGGHAAAASGHDAGASHSARTAQRPWVDPGTTHLLWNWISLGSADSAAGHWLAFNFYFDRLTGLMMLFVTVVSSMVVVYSIGYMRDHHGHPERGYERFFAFLGLFIFSMCVLVLAGNFVVLYMGWELVGLCSYLLIGFYYGKPSAAAAAKKAFIVNRVGDLGFALGIFYLYQLVTPHLKPGENPLDYVTVFKYAGQFTETEVTIASLLLLCGALGKSAQFPLHVWLPDAMEGPSPVSALIHAATMVTAGVYMIARCGPLFMRSELALTVIVWVGVIGCLGAATIALAQFDMKRILAYSTISQLAYMVTALGVGATEAGVFHMFTHAFFKALLFLCAGSVMHAMGGVIDVRHFSGLRQVLPQTQKLMLVGCLALAGFPLLAGFWSKDAIIHASFYWNPVVGGLLTVAAGFTAYYTFRMYFLCFNGPLRLPPEAGDHPHEAPPVMLRPLYFLALGAVFAGFIGVGWHVSMTESFLGVFSTHGYLQAYLGPSTIVSLPEHAGGIWIMYLSALVAIGGIGLAYARYGAAPAADPDQAALGPVWTALNRKYWVDEAYDAVFVRPLRRIGDFFFATDRNGIDGLIWFVSAVPRAGGALLGLLQRGALQGYALSMAIGLTLLLLLWGWMSSASAAP